MVWNLVKRSTEDFAYFTLKQNAATAGQTAQTLFGISCVRQADANTLKQRSADITRSTVQKAVAVITNDPQRLSHMRESLSVVTTAWFAQGHVTEAVHPYISFLPWSIALLKNSDCCDLLLAGTSPISRS